MANLRRRSDTITAEPITLTITDGPANSRVHSANQYDIGDLVRMRYATDNRTARIICTIREPNGTTKTIDAEHGQAQYRATMPGQHWYAFDAYDVNDDLAAIREAFFVVKRQRVPR